MIETCFIDPAIDPLSVAPRVGRDAARWGWPLETFERALARWDAEMEWAGFSAHFRRAALTIAWREYKAAIEAAVMTQRQAARVPCAPVVYNAEGATP